MYRKKGQVYLPNVSDIRLTGPTRPAGKHVMCSRHLPIWVQSWVSTMSVNTLVEKIHIYNTMHIEGYLISHSRQISK